MTAMIAVQSKKRMPSIMEFLNIAPIVLSNLASNGKIYINTIAYAATATRKMAVPTVQKALSKRI